MPTAVRCRVLSSFLCIELYADGGPYAVRLVHNVNVRACALSHVMGGTFGGYSLGVADLFNEGLP